MKTRMNVCTSVVVVFTSLLISCSDDKENEPGPPLFDCVLQSYLDPVDSYFRSTVEYGANKLPERIEFHPGGPVSIDEPVYTKSFLYDDNGHLRRMNEYATGDKFITRYTEYTSDASENIIESKEYVFAEIDVYELNPNRYYLYRYDNKARLIEKVIPPNEFSSDSIHYRYEYNEDGNLQTFSVTEGGLETIERVYSAYDGKTNPWSLTPLLQFLHEDYSVNNPTSITMYDKTWIFAYEYDANYLPSVVTVSSGEDKGTYVLLYQCD